jgi:predicted nucleic acid-binding protein
MLRPKLFLDTDVCINAANGRIDPAEWRQVQTHIGAHYRYFISFITLKELFSKLARGADAFFERNKEPLRALYEPARRRFLPYPSVFALRTVLGMRSAARIHESGLSEEVWAEKVLRAVLDSRSKASLKHGIKVPNQRRILTFDLDHFDRNENAPQNEHAELLQGIREGKTDTPVPRKWAAWILHQHGRTPYTEDCEKLAVGLDSAYCFTFSLSKMAKDNGYDFKTHASDWGDSLQLFYLCDESMHFLTMDADFYCRTKSSSQNSRLLTYAEFARSIAETD